MIEVNLFLLFLFVHRISEHSHAVRVISLVCQVQSCETETVLGQEICSSLHQTLSVDQVTVLRCQVQRSSVLTPGSTSDVDACSSSDQYPEIRVI